MSRWISASEISHATRPVPVLVAPDAPSSVVGRSSWRDPRDLVRRTELEQRRSGTSSTSGSRPIAAATAPRTSSATASPRPAKAGAYPTRSRSVSTSRRGADHLEQAHRARVDRLDRGPHVDRQHRPCRRRRSRHPCGRSARPARACARSAHGIAGEADDVVGAVADERRGAIEQRRRDELAPFAVGDRRRCRRDRAPSTSTVSSQTCSPSCSRHSNAAVTSPMPVCSKSSTPHSLGERTRARAQRLAREHDTLVGEHVGKM